MTTDLHELFHDELDRVVAPPGDLDAVRAGGQRLRRRRGAAAVAGAALVVGVVVAGFAVGGSTDPGSQRGVDPVGRLDYSQGLRAYADPGEVIHLGGREFGAARMSYLDTDAAATPYGVLFYDRGRPMLLEESGVSVALETDVDATRSHPTAKADSQAPLVAYGVTRDGQAEAVVRDLSSDEQVGRLAVPQGTIIDALDAGVVFLRTDDGTTTWDPRTGETQDLAGPETRVADVRNGVLLYDGPAPDGPAAAAYRLVRGTVDAQLTFDGEHVLDWSPVLASTTGGAPLRLDVPKGVQFFTIDTDGSVLAAVRGSRPKATVYDCELPSGSCERLGTIAGRGGDPEFIGNDM